VEEAERWGDEVFQPAPRRLVWWALRQDSSALESFAEGARLGIPLGLALKASPPIVWAACRYNKASDEAVRADLAALPKLLDQVDTWIREGVLGGDEPNAADYQIATGVRLLLTMDDLRPALEGRSAARLAERIVPSFPGRVSPVFPREWLEPLGAARARA
jgi:glutathione S-transferase